MTALSTLMLCIHTAGPSLDHPMTCGHPYIKDDAAVPWFDPIPPIGRQVTQ